MKRPGKKLEAELGPALKHLGCWDYNSNDPSPACDRIVHWRGLPLLIEAKETRRGKVEFANFTDRERSFLNWHAGLPDPKDEYPAPPGPRHGLTVIVVQLILANGARTWVAHWEDVAAMEAASPVKHLVVPPTDPRWVEVGRVERPHSLGRCWHLEPALDRLLETRR